MQLGGPLDAPTPMFQKGPCASFSVHTHQWNVIFQRAIC